MGRGTLKIERFEDIEGWQLGRKLANQIYDLTACGLFAADFGLKDQIQRAAGSIMHNIAEGFDSGTNPEFVRFLGYSKRSCTEVQSELYLALDRGYISQTKFEVAYKLAGEAKAVVGGFIHYLRNHPKP
ncbi:MAG: four helix bundle protein [Kiritimatiellales bacterium]|nr:four helix bundle protein [Kiritimatiellales bacterium]